MCSKMLRPRTCPRSLFILSNQICIQFVLDTICFSPQFFVLSVFVWSIIYPLWLVFFSFRVHPESHRLQFQITTPPPHTQWDCSAVSCSRISKFLTENFKGWGNNTLFSSLSILMQITPLWNISVLVHQWITPLSNTYILQSIISPRQNYCESEIIV